LPDGFRLERVAVEIQGLCAKCAKDVTARGGDR
jgi:hypothetical protein